jgi:hypothetical protein
MKTNSDPSPDGLPTKFYKCFWNQVRELVMEIFNKFYVEREKSKHIELWFDIPDPQTKSSK